MSTPSQRYWSRRGAWVFPGLSVAGVVMALAQVVATAAPAPASAPEAAASAGSPSSADPVERGEYLSRAADCMSCHSAPGGKPYAGGAALHSPFGDLYAPNITTDADTGIGTWTEAEFASALRQGKGKHGEPLYPAMPYDSYTKLSDADVAALWAYMRTVPAVNQKSTPNTLRFPMNVRPGVAVWQAAYFKPGRYSPAAGKDATWNRGGYLVEALGHCGACHTPRNIAQASDAKQRLAGARIEGWYAPDISSDALSPLAHRSVDDVAKYLKTGRMPGNVKAFGPMQEVVHNSLGYLTDADLRAMAVYLKDPPARPASKPYTPAPVPAQELADGKAVYDTHCASCHRADGRGVRGEVPALAGNTGVTARESYNVVTAVLQGFDPQGGWGAMPSYAAVLNDAQIAAVANYVRHSWGNRGEHLANEAAVSSLRSVAQTPPDGERAALLCPVLAKDMIQPALDAGPAALQRSARDPQAMSRLVQRYTTARPQASAAQVIEALSAAYCHALTDAGASAARTSTGVIDFSQQVAQQLGPRAGGNRHGNAPSSP